MSSLASPNDALTFVKVMVKNQPVDLLQLPILQSAAAMIWLAAPWRWTLGNITPVGFSGGAQDYAITVPADFLKFERGWVQDASKAQELQPCASQPVNAEISPPVYFSIDPTGAKVRFNATYPPVGSGLQGNPTFTAVYKKIVPDLTTTFNTPGALVMDDSYFWVYLEAVLYIAYKYADDQRAGSATVAVASDGKVQCQYSGQLGVLHAALEFMRGTENIAAAYPWSGLQPPVKPL